MPDKLYNLFMELQTQEISPATKEALLSNKWITETVEKIEKTDPGMNIEVILPKDIDHLDFIAVLGLPQRDYEIGGLYDQKTRSMLVSRGAGKEDRGFSNPQIKFIRPRRNPDQTTDDIFFHTHPWNQTDIIQHLRDPKNTCEPSDTDTNNIMAIRMIEEEAGQNTKVTSIVSSGGYLTITEANGAKVDETKLIKAGLTSEQINSLRMELALYPRKFYKNFLSDKGDDPDKVFQAVLEFYQNRRQNLDIPFSTKLKKLQEKIKPFCSSGYVNRIYQNKSQGIIDDIQNHFPKYPYSGTLEKYGFDPEQIKLAQEMSGLTIKKIRQL